MEKIIIDKDTNFNPEEAEPDFNSSLSKLRSSSSGIKFLLNIRNLKSEDLENDEFVKENKKLIIQEDTDFNQISDEDFKKNIDEMDELIKDIMNTKKELKMQKIKETVKTREDMLNFYEIKDCQSYNYAPEPIHSDLNYLKKIANTKGKEFQKKDKDFKSIKNILDQQNNFIKDLDLIEESEKDENAFTIKQSFFPTSIATNEKLSSKKNKNSFADINDNLVNSGSNVNKINNSNVNNSSVDMSVSTLNATGYSGVSGESTKNFKFKNPLMNKNSYNLTEEEKEFMNKYVYNTYDSDDLIGDIDSCIKIGEEIDDYINYIEN